MDLRSIMMGVSFSIIWSSAFTSARILVIDLDLCHCAHGNAIVTHVAANGEAGNRFLKYHAVVRELLIYLNLGQPQHKSE